MRVLEVARQFYPKVGGIESCVLNLSRGLTARGHSVEVVTLDRDLQTGRRLDAPGAIDSIAIHRIPYFGFRRYTIAPSWLRLVDDFDVVHIHAIDFFIDSAAMARCLGYHRKPIIVTTHGGIFHTPKWLRLKDFYWRHILQRSLRAVSAIVAVSERDAALFRSIVPPEKMVTIPNGIESAFAEAGLRTGNEVPGAGHYPRHPSSGTGHQVPGTRYLRTDAWAVEGRRRLVCVGRVSAAKAIDKVIKLFAMVAGEFPDVELIIAGPDENGTAETLRRQSAALGLETRVRIVGALPLDELAMVVASARLFISAAPHEGFGITTVEALSAGVPVLVTRTGVHEEILQQDNNGWFWSGLPDAEAAASLRKALLLPDARLDEMRRAARVSAAPFDWNLTTDKYERVLESAYRQVVG
jgi:alpha-1,3-mannosyltransferase